MAKQIFLLGLGDSIMAGGPILGGQPNWMELLQTRRVGTMFSANNAGIGGYTSTQVKTLWENTYRKSTAPGRNYTHLIILIGTNDLAAGTAAATIAANIQSICTEAKTDGLNVTVCTVLPRKNGASYSADLQTRLDALNVAIAGLSNVDVIVDLYTAMGDPGDAQALNSTMDSGDGLHPNAAGHVHIADTIDVAVSW